MLGKCKVVTFVFLVSGMACTMSGAPRSKEITLETVKLRDLNVMTFVPQADTTSNVKSKSTIHTLCKRINKHLNPGAINTTIDTEREPNKKLRVMSGVHSVEDDVIFVYSSPWAGKPGSARYKYNGNGAYTAFLYQKVDVIPGVCVCFDHPTHTRAKASFGQSLDQECLKLVLQEVRRVNPHASIVLVGPCSGSMTILNFICQQPHELANVKAVILESPSISIEHIEQHVMTVRLGALGRKFPRFFKHWFSSYDPHMPTILDIAGSIPHDLPILIGALKEDKTASYDGIQKIVKAIHNGGNQQIYFYTHEDAAIGHGQMGKTKEWPQVVNAFLCKYNLPHVPELAQEGVRYL